MADLSPEDQKTGATVDREFLTLMLSQLHQLAKDYSSMAQKAAEASSTINRDLFALYEKTMLLSLGTIGLSVSALISYVTKFTLHGIHKVFVVGLASTAWLCLLISAFLSRHLMIFT